MLRFRLIRRRQPAATESHGSGRAKGFFSVGVVGAKSKHNLGTLWRSAYQLDAAAIFTIGDRFERQSTDTVKAWRNVPMMNYKDWNAFAESAPYGAVWVAVEMSGLAVGHACARVCV